MIVDLAPWQVAAVWSEHDHYARAAVDSTRPNQQKYMAEDILTGIRSTLHLLGLVDRLTVGPRLEEVRS